VRDAWRLDRPDLLELNGRRFEVVEKTSTVAEQHGDDVKLELVQKPRREVLVGELSAAPEPDVLAAGGVRLPRLSVRSR
jgi:hypothetical protein